MTLILAQKAKAEIKDTVIDLSERYYENLGVHNHNGEAPEMLQCRNGRFYKAPNTDEWKTVPLDQLYDEALECPCVICTAKQVKSIPADEELMLGELRSKRYKDSFLNKHGHGKNL